MPFAQRVQAASTALSNHSGVPMSTRVHRDYSDREELRIVCPIRGRRPGQATGREACRPIPPSGLYDASALVCRQGRASPVDRNPPGGRSRRRGTVGIVDADIYGFSIPRMLGVDREPVVIDQMLVPPERWGVRCISIGYFVPPGQAVIWRGPMLHKALEQFLTDVFWDEPDFLLVDMPPGTGDIALSLSQYLPRGEVYVVTTPQPAAQKVARLSAAMAQKVNLEVKGVIENMSWFTGDDGKRYEIFGRAVAPSSRRSVPLLGQLRSWPALRGGTWPP